MLLPLRTLYNLNTRSSQKWAVMGIFALALVTISFEVLRAVEFYQLDTFYTTLYTNLQVSFAVIISMLPTYRAIISNSDDHRQRRYEFWMLLTFRSRSSSTHSFALHSVGRDQSSAEADSASSVNQSGASLSSGQRGKRDEEWEVRAV